MIQTFNPDYNLVSKSDSTFMVILGWVFGLLGAKTFMTTFWTTIGNTTYCPTDPKELEYQWVVLFHEGKHVVQQKSMGLFFYLFLYLFPLSLSPIFFVLGFFYWPMFILAIITLAPLPAPWRKNFELQGYTAQALVSSLDPKSYSINNSMVNQYFTGSAYYFMWPFGVTNNLNQIQNDIQSGVVYSDPYYKAVRDLVITENWIN
jgi:hypothetical protein